MGKKAVLALSERIRFAKSKVVAYSHLADTYDRQIAEIADERRQLDSREDLLIAAYAEYKAGALDRARKELVDLGNVQARNKEVRGGSMSRTKLQRALDKRARLQAKLAAVIEEHGMSDDEVGEFIALMRGSKE